MTTPTEAVVLCEGFHDRAFWKGWLSLLHCRDARPKLPSGGFGRARDPFGKFVEPGQFAFRTASDAFVRVRSCSGDKGVLAALKTRLAERETDAVDRIVVGLDVDADVADPGTTAERIGRIREGVDKRVRQADPDASTTSDGDFAVWGGATLVSIVLWSAADAATPELPAQQCLERLVCSALRAAYPERAAAVAAWLAARPAAPPSTPKEHAWSHMAGWYANQNCDEFYQAVWRDEAVARELRARLDPAGAWRIAAALAA